MGTFLGRIEEQHLRTSNETLPLDFLDPFLDPGLLGD